MAKKETDIVPINQYQIMKSDPAKVGELLLTNLGGDDMSEFDLERIKWPSGEIPAFARTGEDGNVDTEKEIVGVVIYHGNRRAFWKDKFGEGDKGAPQCSSLDGKFGTGHIPGDDETAAPLRRSCRTCPMGQFGSAKKDDGSHGRGQACQARKMLFLAMPDSILPVGLSIPPTSLKQWKKYAMSCATKGHDIRGVMTKISLKIEQNADGVKHCVGQFAMVGEITGDELEGILNMANSLRDVFASVGIDGDDDGVTPTVHGQVVN
jgi:hypothetical protein